MKIRLDDHEYVIRIPAKAWPHLQVLTQAMSGKEFSEEMIDKSEERVLKICARPEPCEDHAEAVLFHIITRYAQLVKDVAKIFRPGEFPAP